MFNVHIFRSSILLPVLISLVSFTACRAERTSEYAISHVTVIDPGSAQARVDMTILLHGDAIVSVVPSKGFQVPPPTKVINGSGKFVIPGLWDMHMHLRDANRDLKMDLANGVLGVRDMGDAVTKIFPLRDAVASGQQLGPKMIACGPIIDGPNSWSNPAFTISVKNADEARAAIVSLKQQR